MSSIDVRDLDAGYVSVQILHQVSMRADTGDVTCVFGPNGCGKSTMLKAIVGAIQPWGGSVELDAEDITRLPSYATLQRGVALMPQGGGVFPQMSVRDNLRMGGYALGSRHDRDQRVEEQLEDYPRLRERLKLNAGQLSGGEQMMLSIARAQMLHPRFLLFDEPSAGLSPKLVGEVLERISRLAESGVGVIMVEQNIREAMNVADRMYVLAAGQNRFEGRPSDIADDHELMQLYLGVGNREDGSS